MKRPRSHRSQDDLIRVVHLLETLKGAGHPGFVDTLDVEPAVSRRLRGLPHPGIWSPVVSFREFLWGTAAAFALLVLGGVGLIAAFSPAWLSSPSLALESARALAGRVLGALGGLVWATIQGLLERLAAAGPYIDASLATLCQAAVLMCVAMFVLTILVVSHDTRLRRTAG